MSGGVRIADAAVGTDLGEMPKKGGGKFVYFSRNGVAINEEKCYNIVIGCMNKRRT